MCECSCHGRGDEQLSKDELIAELKQEFTVECAEVLSYQMLDSNPLVMHLIQLGWKPKVSIDVQLEPAIFEGDDDSNADGFFQSTN